MDKCQFDNSGVCRALACYSNQECSARDKNGTPIYGVRKAQMTRSELIEKLETILYSQGVCAESEINVEEIADFILENFYPKGYVPNDGYAPF